MSATTILRKKNTGEPGPRGQFGTHTHREPETSLAGADAVAFAAGVVAAEPFRFQDMALSESTAPADLIELAASGHWLVGGWVAANPSAPPEALDILARLNDSNVRARVGAHPRSSTDTLHILASDELRDVRAAAAANPHTSDQDIEALAGDEDLIVKAAILRRTEVPAAALTRLYTDRSRWLHERLRDWDVEAIAPVFS